MKRVWGALAVGAMLVAGQVRADDGSAAVKAFETAWAGINDYYAQIETHITKDNKHEDRIYRFWFKKPMHLRSEITDGNRGGDKGSVAVYNGGDRVQGHQGGMLAMINLSLPLDDTKTTSIRGGRITDLQWGHQLDTVHGFQQHGKIEVGAPTQFEGVNVIPLTMSSTDQPWIDSGNDHCWRNILDLNADTHMPVLLECYEQGNSIPVIRCIYRQVKLNPGVADNAFDSHTRMP